MKVKTIIVTLFIVYITIFFIKIYKTDNIDKKAAYYTFKTSKQFTKGSSFTFYFVCIIKILLAPFFDNMYLPRLGNGAIYGTYIHKTNPKLASNFRDKLWWAHTFQVNNINHPKIVSINGEVKHKIYDNKKYLIKKRNGMLSIGQFKVKGKRVKKLKPLKNQWFAQEFLDDCDNKSFKTYFRLITLYNGKSLSLIEIKEPSNLPVSMHYSRAMTKIKQCHKFKCNNLNKKQQDMLNNIKDKLMLWHKNNASDVISIGWDIMFGCKNNEQDIYVLEGNLAHSHYWRSNNNKQLNHFKNIAIKFYKQQGL